MNTTDPFKALDVLGITAAEYTALADPAITTLYADPVTAAAKNEEGRKAVAGAMGNVLKFFTAVASAAAAYEKTFDDSLEAAMGIYKQIKAAIAAAASVLPPSGAVAGIYARVDNARGCEGARQRSIIRSSAGDRRQPAKGLNVDARWPEKSINVTFYRQGDSGLGRAHSGRQRHRMACQRRFFSIVGGGRQKSRAHVFKANDLHQSEVRHARKFSSCYGVGVPPGPTGTRSTLPWARER